jgi:lysyl-tRNA synthetase class 2
MSDKNKSSGAANATTHPQVENRSSPSAAAKLAAARAQGQPFPNDFRRSALAEPARATAPDRTKLEALGVEVAVAGRMMLKRVMGRRAATWT